MTNPLRVELVEHSLSRANTGIGRYTHELYQNLIRYGDNLSVTLTGDVAPPLAGRFSTLRHFPLAVKAHQRGSIVHFMQIMGCAQMLWHPVRPAVATVHDLGVLICDEDQALFSNRLDRWILDVQLAGLKRMDYLIAVSEFTRQQLIEVLRFPADRVHVVYHGIKHDCFRPIADARAQLAARYPLHSKRHTYDLLYVGSELPRKNLITLLEALVQLKRQGILARLVKVGDAGGAKWRERFLADVARLHLDDDVLLIGSVPEDDLPLFYNAVDVFVTTSLLEGFGLPVLEAMACGLPVVCSNAGSLPEITGAAARLVNPRSPVTVAEAIAALLREPAHRNLLREPGLVQAATFSWENATSRLVQIYNKIIAQ